ncbi:MAG: acyl--CoA ligase [Chloroflexi bacterium]|nr:acyl--CoA ligase [Chloroflexota bacterium]
MSSQNVWSAFEENVKKTPHKAAVIYLGTRYSYLLLKRNSDAFAAALSNMGVKKGDRVVIYAPNSPQWMIAFLGIQRIGAVAVPITPIYTPPDVSFICNNCEARLIVCADANLGYVLQVLPQTKLEHAIVTGVAELLPTWKRFIGKAFDKIPGGRIPLSDKVSTFRQILKDGHRCTPPDTTGEREETCAIMYTGGTTGFPKGVPISHAALLENIYWVKKAKEPVIPADGDVVLQGAPLFHILGLGGGLICPLCIGGDTVLLPPRVNLDGLMDWTQRYDATSLFAVPSFYRMVLEHDRADQYNLTSLQYCLTGGDVVPVELHKRWFDKYRKPLYQAYGITEAAGAVSLSFADEQTPEGSAGRILPCNEAKLVIPGTLEPVPKGEPGELLLSSKHGPKHYWNSPEDTRESFVEADGKIWYRTKDIISIDEKGYLFFVDREADLIKHKGYRIAAAEIERVLQEHPAVIAACAVGVPDARVGERIKAFAVLKEDVRGLSAQELISWCRGKLAPYKVPEYIEFRDSLPKSKVGKLLRREVRSYERKKVEES